jgi:sarcosine oxidase
MGREVDVVVVGGGIMGVATLRALARAGARAVLLEQFELGHARGSSHGESRIFRLSYPNPTYTRLAQEGLASWRALEDESSEHLIVHTGSIDAGDAAVETERSLVEAGVSYEIVSGHSATSRWALGFEQAERLVFEPTGGYIRADLAYQALVVAAQAAGADVVEEARVVRIAAHQNGVVVGTTTEDISAGAVVMAAGAWARNLLAPLGIRLAVVPTRETVVYFACPGADELPAVIEYPSAAAPLPAGQAYYALPAPGRGLKAGLHHSGLPTDPEQEGVPDAAVVDATSEWVGRRFPGADPSPLAAETCIYTNTADESFVIEAHGRIVVASACSGHGFKFAPLLGERVAALALAAR